MQPTRMSDCTNHRTSADADPSRIDCSSPCPSDPPRPDQVPRGKYHRAAAAGNATGVDEDATPCWTGSRNLTRMSRIPDAKDRRWRCLRRSS